MLRGLASVLTLLFILVSANESQGSQIPVPEAFRQISGAIGAASSGDTINVNSTANFDPVTINKALLIRSINGLTPSITASGASPAVLVTASNVSVRGITLRGASPGIAVQVNDGLGGTLFEDCTITTSGTANLGIVGNENLTVRRCTFTNLSTQAIGPTYSSPCSSRVGTLTVETCVFDACGVNFNCVATANLCYSTLDGSVYATYGLPSSNSLVDRTIIANCSTAFSNGCPATITHSILFNTSIGTGCSASGQLTDDPLFCNSREGLPQKYTLRSTPQRQSTTTPGASKWVPKGWNALGEVWSEMPSSMWTRSCSALKTLPFRVERS